MATTYDDIYSYFISITKTSEIDLPSTIESQKMLIRDGVLEYNTRLNKNVECNDALDQVSIDLTDIQIRFIAECMKLRVFFNMLEDFVSVWEVFQNDLGRRDYRSQVAAREYLIQKQEDVLNKLSFRLYEEYIDGD